MSIDANKGKEAVAGLKDSMTEYSDERKTFVNTTDLREALEYVALLEAKVAESEINIGDRVQVTSRGQFIGMTGKLINIEPLAHTYPYSVEFTNSSGDRLAIAYFSRYDLKRVHGE